MKKKIVSCFDIRELPKRPGKWNWDLLSFFPFIFIFEHCDHIQTDMGIEQNFKYLIKLPNINVFLRFQLSTEMKNQAVSTA